VNERELIELLVDEIVGTRFGCLLFIWGIERCYKWM